jgi:membrane protein
MAIVDYGFPLYLSNVTSLRIGTSFLFVLIVLVWFYVLALILLAGAVVNELRFERQAQAAN